MSLLEIIRPHKREERMAITEKLCADHIVWVHPNREYQHTGCRIIEVPVTEAVGK